jgi:hypothetical protein
MRLKIAVSVVRFRPWAPLLSAENSIPSAARSGATRVVYTHCPPTADYRRFSEFAAVCRTPWAHGGHMAARQCSPAVLSPPVARCRSTSVEGEPPTILTDQARYRAVGIGAGRCGSAIEPVKEGHRRERSTRASQRNRPHWCGRRNIESREEDRSLFTCFKRADAPVARRRSSHG